MSKAKSKTATGRGAAKISPRHRESEEADRIRQEKHARHLGRKTRRLHAAYELAKARWGNGARAGLDRGVFWVGRYSPAPVLKITGKSFEEAFKNADRLAGR